MQNQEEILQTVDEDNPAKRKRLGQFFTGYHLAMLLVALAKSKEAATVIDPMCGNGDMLRAAADINPNLKFSGIDIDGAVLKDAEIRMKSFPHVYLIEGNAFNLHNLQRLDTTNFDLVITNPPYVRYQSLSDRASNSAPNAVKVRNDLLEDVNFLLTDSEDRRIFQEIVKSYSGLSDLAVPSWILTAMLTKVGGTLALVVPESWLSRDYAQIIQYMLYRWFKIRYIIEDSNASWFPGVLVKTTLLIADRVNRKQSAFMWQDDYYAHVRISTNARNSNSIIGNIFPNDIFPEQRFTDELASLASKKKHKSTDMWSLSLIRLSDISNNLKNIIGSQAWFRKCEPINVVKPNGINLPIEIRNWLQGRKGLESFEEAGIVVGQGLRTGANSFFYVDFIEESNGHALVAPNAVFNIETAKVPIKYLQPVLRRQSELPDGYAVKKTALKGRVLLLQNEKISDELTQFIEVASKTKAGETLIPQLSAVKTNVRQIGKEKKELTGWYILPTLAHRHIPLLFIPRVNGDIPRAYLNSPGVVIDANFSTIWLNSNSQFTKCSLLALLNSSWSVAAMELSGSVMGGGALKIEATHIKKMPLPHLEEPQLKELEFLGNELMQSEALPILRRIDEVVVGTFFDKGQIQNKIRELKTTIENRFKERTKRE